METTGSKLRLKGFFQGAELGADGQAGALGSYISLEKDDTGEVLNVIVADEEMARILAFVYQPAEAPAAGNGTGDVVEEPGPSADAPEEEPQETAPTQSPFPE